MPSLLHLALAPLRRRWQRLDPARRRQLRRAAVAVPALAVLGLLVLVAARSGLEAPAPTLLLYDRQGRFLGEVRPGQPEVDEGGFGYWPVSEVPERVAAATLAVEDRRFFLHPGVDPVAVARAISQNLHQGSRVSGASTLAMQVARMQRPGERNYARKGLEALTALLLTTRHGREAVLRHYLRIVPYGNRIHGIAYAARRYLDKPVDDLSWAEVAFLTAIPQAPAHMNPFTPQGRARAVRRGLRILDLLHHEGQLNEEDYQLAREQIRELQIPPRSQRPESALHAVLYLGEQLASQEEQQRLATRPLVTTTLDLDLQEEVAWLTLTTVDAWQSQGAGNAAAVVIDRERHEVLAWAGSTGYFDRQRSGAIDYARIRRSPGSTLKPFLYALGLERGRITPATIHDDLERGQSGIGNADKRFLGPLLTRSALANSRNVPAVHLLGELGLDVSFSFFGELGLHDGHESARHYGLGLALGNLPVSLEQLLRAYTALADDGRLSELVWYRDQPRPQPRQVMSEATARQITLFLSDPLARLPSFPRMGETEYPFPVAVKTGTSSQYRDAWTVAYSERYLVGAWVGHPDYRPMNQLSGYRAAAHLVRQILFRLHRDQLDGQSDLSFPAPRGYVPVRLCALTGKRATPACDQVTAEWFPPGQEPPDYCTSHRQLAVDRRNGLLASSRTPPGEIEVRPFVELPARYAAWATSLGLPHAPTQLSPLGHDGTATLATGIAGTSRRATLAATSEPRISITSPENGSRLLRDPEIPAHLATVALRAVIEPPVEQVLWLVDGTPFQLADYPYTARWPLQPGSHTFQVQVPYRGVHSSVVRVIVE